MILYRPHRGTLKDSIKEMQAFSSEEEMVQYIKTTCPQYANKVIEITESVGNDERIGWENFRFVMCENCVIGFCAMEQEKYNYFISFSVYKKHLFGKSSLGTASCEIVRTEKIKNLKDLKELTEEIEDEFELPQGSVAIMYFRRFDE